METIGRYIIQGELGRGGCGVVYRALDPTIGRTVAIKTIRVGTETGDLRERFRREAHSAGILSHPNIVTIHEFSDTADVMFIAMEFVDGQTLAERMREGVLPIEFTLAIIRAAAGALDFAHAHNIVHRDVKPANFLITKQGHLRMADFGIAKLLDSDVGLTHTGMVVGTAQYMSPEQIGARDVTGQSDQFSLAVIAYEMLTGKRPFQGNSWASLMHAIMATEPPPLKEYQKQLGDVVTDVLRKGLAKDAEHRYPSCTAFAEALERSILGPVIERAAPPLLASVETVEMPPPKFAGDQETVALESSSSKPRVTLTGIAPPAVGQGPPPAAHGRSWAIPIVAGAFIVIGLATWLVLKNRTSPTPAARPPVVSTNTTLPARSEPVRQVPEPSSVVAPPSAAAPSAPTPALDRPAETVPDRAAETKPVRPTETTTKNSPNQTSRETGKTKPFTPPPKINPPVSQPVVTAQPPPPLATSTPAPSIPPPFTTPAAPPRAEPDPAIRAAEEQAKRAADDRATRISEDHAKAATEEKARSERAADIQAVSRALTDYQKAYQHKDLGALQTIWPTISKPMLEGIRGSFRDASEVSMELRPIAEPDISGSRATVTCDRNVRQVILKKPMEASSRVRIVLNRSGGGWAIQSIDPVNR